VDMRTGAGHYVGTDGAIRIARALTFPNQVTTLDLSVNEIEMPGAVAVAEMLKVNSGLESLRIGWNDFGSEGAIRIIRAAAKSGLKELNLSGADIGDHGAFELRKVLQQSKSCPMLNKLDLSYNDLSVAGRRAVIELVQQTQSMHYCEMRGNGMSEEEWAQLREALYRNRMTVLPEGSSLPGQANVEKRKRVPVERPAADRHVAEPQSSSNPKHDPRAPQHRASDDEL